MKESWYLRHDLGARNDGKMLKLRTKFGNAEGYGIFWMVVEVMAESDGGMISCSAYDELALSFGIGEEKIREFIDYCVSIGLFLKEKDSITSKRIQADVAWRKERSASGKKGAAARERNKKKEAKDHAEHDTQDDTKADHREIEREIEKEVPTPNNVSSKTEDSNSNDAGGGAKAPTPSQEARKFFSDEETRQRYADDIIAQGGGDRSFVEGQMQQFFDYWMERNKSGTQHKWEQQPTFEVKLRIATWFRRNKEGFGKSNVQKAGSFVSV